MESLISEEKHVPCRYCNGIVYASHPVCAKCGLEMTSEGVVELSEVENRTFGAADELYKLKLTSGFFLVFTIAGFAFSYMLELIIFFHLYFWMGIVTVFFNFTGWNRKYSTIDFTLEDSEMIKRTKREILGFFFCNLVVGLGIYIFLLS